MAFTSLRAASAALLIALVAACDGDQHSPGRASPTAPSFNALNTSGVERWVEERFSDFTGSIVAYPCGEGYTEQILMEGQVFSRYTITWTPSGGLHSLTQSMPIGLRGVGLTSGAEYRIAEREHGTFDQGAMGQTASSYKSFLSFHAPSIHARGRLIVGGRFTVNANGEVVIERPVLQADCSTENT